jgi:hypothetical protein
MKVEKRVPGPVISLPAAGDQWRFRIRTHIQRLLNGPEKASFSSELTRAPGPAGRVAEKFFATASFSSFLFQRAALSFLSLNHNRKAGFGSKGM